MKSKRMTVARLILAFIAGSIVTSEWKKVVASQKGDEAGVGVSVSIRQVDDVVEVPDWEADEIS